MAHEENPYAPPQAPSYAPPPPPGGGSGRRLPWEERSSLGFFPAMVDTLKLVLTDPRDAYSRIRPDGDYVSPLLFGMLVSWVMGVISQMWSFGFSSVLSFGDAATVGVGLAQIALYALLYPVIHLVVIFLGAGIYHLALMVASGLANSEFQFEGTFKVVSYAMAANLASIVPLIGPFISLAGMLYLLVIGFQQAHRASQKQALIGALLPMVLCCLCAIGSAMFFGAAAAGLAGFGAG